MRLEAMRTRTELLKLRTDASSAAGVRPRVFGICAARLEMLQIGSYFIHKYEATRRWDALAFRVRFGFLRAWPHEFADSAAKLLTGEFMRCS